VIFKEAHLVSSHNVQFSFKFIDGVTRDAVFDKLIPSIDYSFTEEVFPKVKVASVFHELDRVTSCGSYTISFNQRVNRNSD